MKKKISLLTILISVITLFSGCGSVYESHQSSYTENTSIQGVTFDAPTQIIAKATAINNIVSTEEYDGAYIYKNGVDEYVLFSMKEMLVICGPTEFDWQNNGENATTLASDDILGAWLKIDTDTEDFKTNTKNSGGIYKIVGNAHADYSVTPKNYNTFDGYFATINNGEQEYSMFVGFAQEELYSSNKDLMQHIVKSLSFNGDAINTSVDTTEEKEEVDTTGESNVSEEETVEVIETPSEDSTVETDEIPEETLIEEQSEESEENAADDSDGLNEDEEEIIATTISSDEEPEEPTEEASTDTTEENAETIEDSEPTEDNGDDEQIISENTMDLIDDSISMATVKVSTCYAPLSLGEYGQCYTLDKNGENQAQVVCVSEVFSGDEAKSLIDSMDGRKANPKEGTHFEVAKFTTTADTSNEYIDVKIEGLDGERLVYRGVSYTKRVYDLTSKEPFVCYVYYEVPNGCKEYLLELGIQTNEIEIPTANYYIKGSGK